VVRCLERSGRTLGLVVPLSGEYAEYGASLRNGAALAIGDSMVLALRVEDTGSDPVDAVRAIGRLASAPDVIAAIGPLESRAATGAAVSANQIELPLLMPLSAPTGLSRLGPWVLQSSAPRQAEAKAVARYGMVDGGLSRFAVLYPSHAAGERAMEAFRDQVLGLGGDVVALERYAEGRDTNFRDQIVNLKRAAPQALFVPGEPREITQIARQIAFYDLECQILGTSGWGLPDVIAEGGRLVEGVVFADVVGMGRDPHAARLFAARYHDVYRKDPDHYASLGFDLASVVWEEVSRAVSSREELRRNLAERGPYEGVSGILSWRDDDAAGDVRLYTISNGLAVPLHTRTR
jgi:branched-chain amino acid transport system substrate-binding protein